MNYENIKKDLDFKYPQLKLSFGSLDNFISNISKVYNSKTIHKLTTLLNFKKRLVILTPLRLRFSLYDSSDINGIIFEEPYFVYNSNRELLYKVSSHNGIFGDSILDSLLNLEFPASSFFYLEYSTYTQKEQIILLNGLNRTNITKDIKLTSKSNTTLIKSETFNKINISLISDIQDVINNYPIKVYYLQTNSPVLLTRTSIISSSFVKEEIYTEPNFLINPITSGWLTFSQVTSQGEIPLSLTLESGIGVGRLIQSSPYVYYFAGLDINLNTVKQFFNLEEGEQINFDNQLNIDIKATLSN